jgi:hypothetical protein
VNSPYSLDAMRARFWLLTQEVRKIRAASEPLRAQRDKILADAARAVRELEEKYKKLEEPLASMENERAVLARALGGKTGEEPNG